MQAVSQALCHSFIKVWTNKSYRDVIEIISSNPSFVALLSLSEIPRFTTIQKFCKRIDMKFIELIFYEILKFLRGCWVT